MHKFAPAPPLRTGFFQKLAEEIYFFLFLDLALAKIIQMIRATHAPIVGIVPAIVIARQTTGHISSTSIVARIGKIPRVVVYWGFPGPGRVSSHIVVESKAALAGSHFLKRFFVYSTVYISENPVFSTQRIHFPKWSTQMRATAAKSGSKVAFLVDPPK